MSDDILQQQIAYYRARAVEYDEWFYRLNRYDHGDELNRQWVAEAQQVRDVLHALGRFGRILELAAGTGIWTQELASMADHVTAIDASEEVLKLNEAKLQAANVLYEQRDLFQWQPDQQYDLVFFGFWLSHVPMTRAPEFLDKVFRATRPGGHIFLIDSRRQPGSTAANQSVITSDSDHQTRRLNNGSEYKIIKIYYEPDVLTKLLSDAAFEPVVATTERFFIYGHASRTEQY